MPSQSLLQILGAKGDKETRYAPIFTDRFFVGNWSNRNPLRSPLSTFYADGWHLGGTDAILSGTNIELSPRLTLCRRPGNLEYSTATIPTPPLTFYPFELFGGPTPAIDMIVDTAGSIYTLTPTSLNSIFTKTAGAGQANFLGIGNTLYFGDGVEVQAWQNNAIRNWGIAIGSVTTGSPEYAGTVTAIGIVWTNLTNAEGPPDGMYATASVPTGQLAGPLSLTNYGFSVPSDSQVVGVAVEITGYASIPGLIFTVQLLVGGVPSGDIRYVNIPTVSGPINVGGPSDTFSLSLNSLSVNDSTFGVAVEPPSIVTSPAEYFVDAVKITVYSTGGPTPTPGGSGSLAVTTGWEYVIAYGNSQSGAVSSSTVPGASTGPFSGAAYVGVPVVASTDPQVNQIWVFRTADGGSTFLNLPTSPYPNTSTTIQDSAPDSQLNILQQAPLNMVNNPPLSNSLDPVFYLGLVWVHYGNAVAFSRVASAIVGNTNEAFPPANAFTFPETVIRKMPTSAGLLVFTTANVYIILGNNTAASVLYSAPFITGYGIQSWNALWNDGSIIYFFTSDNRLIELNPSSGVSDLGFPIGDQLSQLNPANVYVTYHSSTSNDTALYVGDGSVGWYRCNPNQAPDASITGPVWSPKATIVGGLQALVGVQTAPGVHRLMMGGSGNNEPVLVRDSSYTTFTDNGTAYPANCVIGSIVLAQPGQAAICRFVTCDFIRRGTSPIVSVLLGEISGSFESISGYVVPDPPYLVASTSLYSNRYYFKQTIGGATPPPVVCRHLQMKIDFGTDTVQNELISSTINGAIFPEK